MKRPKQLKSRHKWLRDAIKNSHKQPHLLIFSSDTCLPCAELKLQLDAITAHKPHLAIRYIDYDTQHTLADKFSIEAVPTTILILKGQEIGRRVGTSASVSDTIGWIVSQLVPEEPKA